MSAGGVGTGIAAPVAEAGAVGVTPAEAPAEARACDAPPRLTSPLPIGDGKAMLARRPDIRQAARTLKASAERVGVSIADLFPTIRIGGNAGVTGPNTEDLDQPTAFSFSVGPLLTWSFPNIFTAHQRIEAASARNDQALALWDGAALSEFGLSYADTRLSALGSRTILPPDLVAEAAADLGATLTDAAAYDAHRIALGVPRGGEDFIYGDAFPHEADMDQLAGVDFDKGCYVGQEVVSRVEHRGSARSRIVPVTYEFAPASGQPVMAGEKEVGTLMSTAKGHGLAMIRLDRAVDALAAGTPLTCGNMPVHLVKPAWARFAWPGEAKAS